MLILHAYIAYLYLYSIFLMIQQKIPSKMHKDFLPAEDEISVSIIYYFYLRRLLLLNELHDNHRLWFSLVLQISVSGLEKRR